MDNHITLNVDKIHRKYEISNSKQNGMMIDSNIRGLKYIIIGNSIIMSTIKNGVFAIDMDRVEEFVGELMGMVEMYGEN